MVLDIASFLTSTLQKQWKTNHLDNKSDVCVVEASQVGRRFKAAVEKEFTKTFLNDAEFVAAITCTRAAPEPEEPKDENPIDENPEEKTPEKTAGDTETSDPEDAESAKKLNESVGVQDLTKSMLSTQKSISGQKTKKCASETDSPKKTGKKDSVEKKADPKKEDSCDSVEKTGKTADPETEKRVDEAETEATGDKLKLKVQEAIKTALQIKDANQKVDLEELPGYQEGYDVYFIKLAFKTKKSDSPDSEG